MRVAMRTRLGDETGQVLNKSTAGGDGLKKAQWGFTWRVPLSTNCMMY